MTKTVCSKQIRWTTSLSSELLSDLEFIAERTMLSNQSIAGASLINKGVNFVEKGTLAICIQTPNLKTANCLLVGEGGWFGNYIDDAHSLSSFIMIEIEPCSIVHFSNQKLTPITRKNNEIFKWFYSLTFESREKWLQSQIINNANITERIVYQLIEILAHISSKSMPMEIAISQQQLSDMTGIARQRVNEVMKELERNQMVSLHRAKIIINSIEKLARYLDDMDLSIRDPRNII